MYSWRCSRDFPGRLARPVPAGSAKLNPSALDALWTSFNLVFVTSKTILSVKLPTGSAIMVKAVEGTEGAPLIATSAVGLLRTPPFVELGMSSGGQTDHFDKTSSSTPFILTFMIFSGAYTLFNDGQ